MMEDAEPPEHHNAPSFAPLDEHQAEAHTLLQDLHRRLGRTRHPAPTRGWLGRIRKRRGSPVPTVRGLYLWGGVGRGKTHLMDSFFEETEEPRKKRLHFHHFMREVHGELARMPPQPDPLELLADRLASRTRLLCLDEFIVTDITDAMILHGLLRAFFERGITLVTTSNTPPEDLYANGLQRDRFLPAIALLQQHTRVFHLEGGTDHRLRALKRAKVYFTPLDDAAASGMEQHFANLAGTRGVRDQALRINDRDIRTLRTAPGVVWIDFSELCEGPRATSDYIEIAREYHTVLLSGVPLLTPPREAAARRFLHLVDELYDRNVNLVISAVATIAELYTGSDLAFEYERLTSRLTEMQSVDYLARPHLPL